MPNIIDILKHGYEHSPIFPFAIVRNGYVYVL